MGRGSNKAPKRDRSQAGSKAREVLCRCGIKL